MKAVELVAPRDLRLTERETPEPGPNEVRLAVSHVGICGTDLEFYRGRRSAGYPFVLGHECAGRVDAVGRGAEAWTAGTPVTVRPNFGCGTCAYCRAGRENVCPDGRGLGVTIDGCLAEFVVVPARYLWRIPDGMDLETAALIEPTAVAERAVRRAGSIGGRRLLVLGAGSIGLLATRIATLGGAEVAVADPVAGRRSRALAFGASRTFDSDAAELQEETFDVVIETAGAPAAASAAVERVRPGGRIVLTGIPMDPAPLATRFVVWRELELVGSFIYETDDFERACDRIARGEIAARDVVTDRFDLGRVGEAFERAAGGESLKVLIEMTERVSEEAS